MIIQAFPSGPFSTNAYVIACPETSLAAIIDPAPGSAEPIQAYLEKNKLNATKILLTHSHWDHIADISKLKEGHSLQLLIHPLDLPNLERPTSDGLPCSIFIPPEKADRLLQDGDSVEIGKISLSVIHTPGHSPGSICFYNSKDGVLISGDTLFRGAIGNISFPTSKPHLMKDSLLKLSKLPEETKVYPGHGSSTTIGRESRTFHGL